MSKDHQKYGDQPPIPTYEEATRPYASQSHLGPGEISDDAERQGLLRLGATHQQDVTSRTGNAYYTPTVESGRSSFESTITSPELAPTEDEDIIEEMEVLEPDTMAERLEQRRARLRHRFRKRFAILTDTLSSLHLPSIPRRFIPSFGFLTNHFPRFSEPYKPNWPIIARLFGLFIIVSSVYALVILRAFPAGELSGYPFDPEWIRQFVQHNADPMKIRHYLQEVTKDDHVAGTKGDIYLAEWIKEKFIASGLVEVEDDMYYVYLNYPKKDGRRVAIIDPPSLAWEAHLEEEIVNTMGGQHQTLAFHGHSRSGNVTGPLIYANYGSTEDFTRLRKDGINLNGSIVLLRYYGSQGDRAMKVKNAELAGAVGCLIYSDPADDGFVQGEPWPEGRWRTSDSIQRGAVSLMSWVVGDVLTPGWASTREAKRVSKDNNPGLVNIPSLPLAWRDAEILLQALQGHGRPVPIEWKGGVPKVDEWWTGNSTSPTIHLMNIQEERDMQPIKNVIGRIPGIEDQEKTIYVGNHRDAWCFGATDPGTGTAVLLEVVRLFGELYRLQWRPRRSIVFASWDAEEYNLVGSTEHVEDRIEEMRQNGVAYLNVDLGVVGKKFWAAASPVFERPLLRVLNRVTDPASNFSLRHMWDHSASSLEGLGAGSDYVAFQSLAGTSSIDFGFRGKAHSYPYHSCYDTYDFVNTMIDPTFEYHAALAQVWALMILELADEPILPFDFPAYAREAQKYVVRLQKDVVKAERSSTDGDQNGSSTFSQSSEPTYVNLSGLHAAVRLLHDNAQDFDKWGDHWENIVAASGMLENRELMMGRRSHNARMSWFETNLLDLPSPDEGRGEGGVPGRGQFKHVIFGPSLQDGYEEAYFPAIRDALETRDWDKVQAQVDIVTRVIMHAAEQLIY